MRKDSITQACERCGREFTNRRSRMTNGRGHFCSRLCQRTRTERTCEECGAKFVATESRVAQGWGRWCSQQCRGLGLYGAVAARLLARTDFNGPIPAHVPELGPCYLYTGARSDKGYGTLKVRGKQSIATRAMWEEVNGPIPAGLFVCHRCDNPPCIRLAHLFLGTHGRNMADKTRKARSPSGEHHHNAKLTRDQVLEIRVLFGTLTHRLIAERFSVSTSAIDLISSGRNWTSVR